MRTMSFGENLKRFIDTWYDVLISTVFILAIVGFFIFVSVSLIRYEESFLSIHSILPQDRAFEYGIALLGVTISVGASIGFAVVRNGTERKVEIRRVYSIHQHFLRHLVALRTNPSTTSKEYKNLLLAFKGASLMTVSQVFSCSTAAHSQFEIFRVELFVAGEQADLNADGLADLQSALEKFCYLAYGRVVLNPLGSELV